VTRDNQFHVGSTNAHDFGASGRRPAQWCNWFHRVGSASRFRSNSEQCCLQPQLPNSLVGDWVEPGYGGFRDVPAVADLPLVVGLDEQHNEWSDSRPRTHTHAEARLVPPRQISGANMVVGCAYALARIAATPAGRDMTAPTVRLCAKIAARSLAKP
jgi:hypothetical protein